MSKTPKKQQLRLWRDKRGYKKPPITARVLAAAGYLFPISTIIGRYGRQMIRRHPFVIQWIKLIPLGKTYVLLSMRHSKLPSTIAIFLLSYRLFLNRSRPLIKTHYFFRHHFFHGMIAMMFLSIIENFVLTFYVPQTEAKRFQQIYVFLWFWTIQYLPMLWRAVRGRYNDLPFITENVEAHLGLNPEDKEYYSWYSGSYEDHSNHLDEEERQDLEREEAEKQAKKAKKKGPNRKKGTEGENEV